MVIQIFQKILTNKSYKIFTNLELNKEQFFPPFIASLFAMHFDMTAIYIEYLL